MDVSALLFENRDLKYRDFHKKLIPGVEEDRIIGVRVPQLRKIAKGLENDDFGWYYYEENMLHGFYIGLSKLGYEEKLSMLDAFIEHIDNWAVCDSAVSSFKFIAKNRESFLKYIEKYAKSEKEYELRFVVVVLMDYYLTDEYVDFCLNHFVTLKSDYYYVKMAVAWALSKAFVRYESLVLPILEQHLLDVDTEKMAIRKIKDSYQVSKEKKQYLNTLKQGK